MILLIQMFLVFLADKHLFNSDVSNDCNDSDSLLMNCMTLLGPNDRELATLRARVVALDKLEDKAQQPLLADTITVPL
jgi:hypothetical protein